MVKRHGLSRNKVEMEWSAWKTLKGLQKRQINSGIEVIRASSGGLNSSEFVDTTWKDKRNAV